MCVAACVATKSCIVAADAGAAAVENYKEMRGKDIFDFALGRLGGEAEEDDAA